MTQPAAAPARVAVAPSRVAVAGATGFVGKALLPVLARRYEIAGLGRRAPEAGGDFEDRVGVRWRTCDLFSLRSTEEALRGAEIGVYLVHSMMPTARLTQASFQDLDLLLADNFGRAAAAAGLRRIVFLGGLVPTGPDEELSEHLASRVETEQALGAYGVPVTAVRAGLVVGAGGSSLQILVRLVERLPVMLCPRWTSTRTQPIALEDVVAILEHCVGDEETKGRICEVGGPDVLTYRDMMRTVAEVQGRRRLMLPVPFFSPGFSRLWVSLFGSQPKALVAPLIESLRHPMLVHDRWLQERMGRPGVPFREALARALRATRPTVEPIARSLQRLPLPHGWDAQRVAREYADWIPRFFRPLMRVEQDGLVCRFHWRGLRRAALELTARPERSSPDRALLEVTGGLLAGPPLGNPRLEFRITPDGEHVLAAVQDFHPRLPWWIYKWTQAVVHALVMSAFGRHLTRRADGD